MSDQSQRTEKPTPRRLQKAREQGQFPQAKEMVSALQFVGVLAMLSAWGGGWVTGLQVAMRQTMEAAFRSELTVLDWTVLLRTLVLRTLGPMLAAGAILAAATLLLQLASTNLGVSAKGLTPDFKRFNPISKLKQLGRQNLPSAVQGLLILGIMVYILYAIAQENLAGFLMLPFIGVREGLARISAAVDAMLWKLAFVLVLFGAVEMIRHRWLHHKDLRMSRQEIRDEHKEQEGDPHIKARVRRLRRELLRRQMMRDVSTATTVIVNPTHYSVAIRYDAETMACPKVVAKGRNFLALRIRERARENDVPIVENPPLARALYSAVDVGRDIPQEFYKAIAEVLAFIYRTMGQRAPGAQPVQR